MTLIEKITEFFHQNLIESVLVNRHQNRKLIYGLLVVFFLINIAIPTSYYYLYIDNQLQRIDIDYRSRHQYDLGQNKLTCDCALPIMINPAVITQDANYLQPAFSQCLTTALSNYYPSTVVNGTVKVLLLNILVIPLNTQIQTDKEVFKNLQIGANSSVLDKIGNFAKLRYANEIHKAFFAYLSVYTVNMFEYVTLANKVIDTNQSDPIYDTLFNLYQLKDTDLNILLELLKCYTMLDFESIDPLDFIQGVTEADCLPVNCHLFANYSLTQTIILIGTFYLAVIGYFVFVLQCIYQKFTKILVIPRDIEAPTPVPEVHESVPVPVPVPVPVSVSVSVPVPNASATVPVQVPEELVREIPAPVTETSAKL